MRVVHQVLPPRVQHGQEADLRAQMLWIGSIDSRITDINVARVTDSGVTWASHLRRKAFLLHHPLHRGARQHPLVVCGAVRRQLHLQIPRAPEHDMEQRRVSD
jgi:hypothetical protein